MELQSVWKQIEAYLSDGISLIPVREKQELLPNGTALAAKTPYGNIKQGTTWKQFQSRIASKDELWAALEKYNTCAVAMVGGKVSGNLEIIDIDVKYFAGIDAILFADIDKFFPALFAKLRIHKTPSGGYHLLYRVADGEIPSNMKLAGRPASDEELKTAQTKVYNFLETRGEGGYALLPPSMGYAVQQDVPIPVITWAERMALISLCQSYTKVTKVERISTPNTNQYKDGYYSENPFEHFNNSPEAETILDSHGWKFFNENATYKYYTRPDRPQSGISASFHKEKRIYYIWTTSSQIDSQKWFNPATLLADLDFNNDKKRLHSFLVSKGYGKLSEKAERKIIKDAKIGKAPLPANISEGVKKEIAEIQSTQSKLYPYGTFWQANEDGAIVISRERLYNVSENLGFRLHADQPVRIVGYQVEKLTPRDYFDELKHYIKEEDADLYEEIANAYEAFIQRSGDFTISRLPILDTAIILQSTKTTSYKFYSNNYIAITAEGTNILEYADITGKIWQDSIQPRDFDFCEPEQYKQSLYYRFLEKAIGITPTLLQSIGYYAHEYKDEEGGYFIVLSEQCEDPRMGGGSGKNVFSGLFKYTTTYKNIPGTQVQFNEKFLQSWNGQRVFSISDVPKRFDFLFLKELTSGSGILKKLYANEQSLESKDMPKLLISTNYSYEVSDGGLKRRIIPIEFTDFFTIAGGVNAHFNAMFPEDWTTSDWLGYDNIMALSIEAYLANRGRLQPQALTGSGWVKQYDQVYGALTRQFIVQNMDNWQALPHVKNDLFNQQYKDFCNENSINPKFHLSSVLMNRALAEYCEHFKIKFNKDYVIKENSVTIRCRKFGVIADNSPEMPF